MDIPQYHSLALPQNLKPLVIEDFLWLEVEFVNSENITHKYVRESHSCHVSVHKGAENLVSRVKQTYRNSRRA
jgi:hypothetical protein